MRFLSFIIVAVPLATSLISGLSDWPGAIATMQNAAKFVAIEMRRNPEGTCPILSDLEQQLFQYDSGM